MAKGEITAQEGSFPLTRGKRGLVQILSSPRRLIPAHAGKTMPPTASLEAHRAHPRSRGENVGDFASGPGGQGSSPLTRGKRANAHRGFLTVRLIPAHAGKTWSIRCMAFCGPAHPRSRGENISAPASTPSMRGSSPLTRGKLDLVRTQVRTIGLIPAHAGKTRPGMPTTPSRPAHPRSRGENFQAKTIPARGPGSSPLTRGKRERRRDPIAGARLIPAHAGKTAPGPTPARGWAAHPRSRGENITWIAQLITSCGSSPLTRGKLSLPVDATQAHRLIPAHAGKTRELWTRNSRPRAHPRSRGENIKTALGEYADDGSSPLTRGKRTTHSVPRKEHGLIPAHAGKTTPHTDHTHHTRAHPRSRGDNSRVYPATESCSGSSPLTRGKRRDPVRPRVLGRLIPAHAGKTPRAHARASSSRAHPRSRGENSR